MENKTKKQTAPARRGRPTKYEGPATVARVEAIAEGLRNDPKNFDGACGMEQLADRLGVHRDTLLEWGRVHPDFSGVLKTWLTARNAAFYRQMRTMPPAIWIFLAKNWLGMRDKQTIEIPANEELKFEFDRPTMTIEVVHTKADGTPIVPPPPTARPAGDMSDAELEAEISRLRREGNDADTP